MLREVRSPDGTDWRVEIDWVARRARNPFRRSVQLIRDRRAARKQRREDRKSGDGAKWYDYVDLPAGDLDDLAFIAVAIVAVALIVVLAIFVLPIVWAILMVLVEFFFVTIAAILVLVWRTLLRRPWRVLVRRGDETWTTEVVGYRTARSRVREVADRLATGMGPLDQGFARAIAAS